MSKSKFIWIQCDSDGVPYFPSASENKFYSRRLLVNNLYSHENMTWEDIKAEGWQEKRFEITEVKE